MSPLQIAELREEADRLGRQLNIMCESYRVMEAECVRLKLERDGLLESVERLSLDLHLKDKGFIHIQD